MSDEDNDMAEFDEIDMLRTKATLPASATRQWSEARTPVAGLFVVLDDET